MVEGEGFEPSKAEPSDLQSDPFGHSGTPPELCSVFYLNNLLSVNIVSISFFLKLNMKVFYQVFYLK